MSRPDEIKIYERNGDMYLSCVFLNDKTNETETLFHDLTKSHQINEWIPVHNKLSIRLFNDNDKMKMEFTEINNPPGLYGRPMVFNIIPAFLMENNIIDKTTYDYMVNIINSSEVVKKRVEATKSNQSELLASRNKIMDSFKK